MNKKFVLPLTLVAGIAIGGAGTHFYKESQEPKISSSDLPTRNLSKFYDRTFDSDFFQQNRSPFEQMKKMSEEMDKMFEESFQDMSKLTFDNWYEGRFGGSINDIKQEEDEKYVHYRIDLEGLDKDSVKVDVSGGQVNVSGSSTKVEAQEEGQGNVQSEVHRSFHRIFPVPANVDANRVEIETKGDEIHLKFPKKKNLI